MLSLAEQLMLLALHDEKGSVIFSASTALPYGLAGAVLLDLFFKNKITLQDKKVQVIDAAPTGDALLDEALALIQSSSKNRSTRHWVGKINSKVKGIRKRTVERLVEQNILKQEEHRFLWFFNVNRYPTLNAVPELEVRSRIRNIVLHDHSANEQEIALLSLTKACELTGEVFGKSERKEARRKIKQMTRDEEIGKAVSAVVAEITTAITMAVIASTAASSGSN